MIGRKKKSESKKMCRSYRSIDDMPLYNWKMIYREGDFRYMLQDADSLNIESLHYDEQDLMEGWDACYSEYLTEFALDGRLKKVLKLESQIHILTAEMWIQDRPSMQTKIDVLKKQKAQLEIKQQEGVDFDTQVAVLEKWLGIHIKEREVSVRRFYTYQKLYEKEAKNIKYQNAKNQKG